MAELRVSEPVGQLFRSRISTVFIIYTVRR